MTPEKLIELAKEAMTHSYSPYSGYKVGAALLCGDGTVYTGCNIENAGYSATVCAERTAVFKAVSEGHRRFKRIVVAGRSDSPCVPCGECRQVLSEFSPELEVICLDKDGNELALSLTDLLPHSFNKSFL